MLTQSSSAHVRIPKPVSTLQKALGSRMWGIAKFTSQHDRATLLTANLKI